MKEDLIPSQKDKNLFWATIITGVPLAIIAGLFAGAFFRLTELLNWGFWTTFFIFIDFGLLLIILMILMKKQIKPVNK